MTLNLAIKTAQRRQKIVPRGSSSISRMCAVLKDGTCTFIGSNSYRTHPLVKKFSKNSDRCCVHAELSAIIKAVSYFTKIAGTRRHSHVSLAGFSLYVARVLADDSPALARPCNDCERAIKFYGIKEVYWTT